MNRSAQKQLSAWLAENRYTQREFAKMVGMSEFHMCRILSETRPIVPSRIARKSIANVTALEIEEREMWL